jgi:PIN domain nuclease of toxin-antitoxin system
MKVLLDTHTFLWGIIDESKLSPKVRTCCLPLKPGLACGHLTLDPALRFEGLESHHRDPFDRAES